MMNNWAGFHGYATPWLGPGAGMLLGFGVLGIIVVVLWSLYWKGMALWHAARQGEKVWFVVFLVVNTLGILEILYLYVFSKKTEKID